MAIHRSSRADTGEPAQSGPMGLPQEALERLCMRNLLTSSEERVFFKDRDGRFLLVSDGFAAALGGGSSAAELVGKTDLTFSLTRTPRRRLPTSRM
jgi:PAS domain-containing protein